MIHRCVTKHANKEGFRDLQARWHATSSNRLVDQTVKLQVPIRYVVLYDSADQKIDSSLIQANHDLLNQFYGGTNTQDLAKVPNSAISPWGAVIGTPNITFVQTTDVVTVEYVSMPAGAVLSSTSPVDDVEKYVTKQPEVLNVVIAPLRGGILGQAQWLCNGPANLLVVDYRTVGSVLNPGLDFGAGSSIYNQGKTMVHEIGHTLGLVHPFEDDVCDGIRIYTDIPEQVNPNYCTVLLSNTQGDWSIQNDNRYYDRILKTDGSYHSCLSSATAVTAYKSCLYDSVSVSDPNTAVNEMGINAMDYGSDDVALMFSKNQSDIMRSFVQSSFSWLSSVVGVNTDGTTTTITTNGGSGVASNCSGTSTTATSAVALSLGAIIGIVIGGLLVVAFAGYWFWHASHGHSMMTAMNASVASAVKSVKK